MAKTRAAIVGAERVRSLLDFDQKVRARLRAVFSSQGAILLQRAQTNANGASLNVRKGRLLRSIKLAPYEGEYGFGVRVYSPWYIARFWEKGFGGGKEFSVKAHVRQQKSRSVKAKVENKLGQLRAKKVAQGIAFVKAYTRTINQPARPFLRPALDSMREEIRAAVAQAVKG